MLHLYFWVFMISINYFRYSTFAFLTKTEAFSIATGIVATTVVPVYLQFYVLKKFLFGKKYFLYVLSVVLILGIAVPINKYLDAHIFFVYSTYYLVFYNLILFMLMFTGLKLVKKTIHDYYTLQEAQTQKIQAELHLLQAQINPHFLFNTLNNLYSLTLDKSDQAPATVLRLAELMRYMLETVKKNTVQLSDEISFIRNYLELEKLRLKKGAKIEFVAPESSADITLPPMLFIPFIENAFKHGVGESTGDFFVTISLSVTGDKIIFSITNSIPPRMNGKVSTTNTGLENIQRRLELLYKKDHSLDITHNDMLYSVKLSLTQNSKKEVLFQ